MVKLEGTLYDIIIFVDSSKYPIDFLVLNPINNLEGHPLILGKPWLATTDAYIGCYTRSMTTAKVIFFKNFIIYPPAKPSIPYDNLKWLPPDYEEGSLCSPLTIDKDLIFKRKTRDDTINGLISQPSTIGYPTCHMLKVVLDNEA